MKVVITGCAGFIGVNLTNYWLKKFTLDTVIGVDCLTYAANLFELENLKKQRNFNFYKINICDKAAIDALFDKERPDAVINLAAESHVDRSIDSSEIFIKSNVLGVQTLLDACLKYKVKRFHQVSTDEVYGDLPLDSDDSFCETDVLNPSSPYSASKAAADLLVTSYFKTHKLSVTISRASNNYGKFQHPEKLIPKTILNVLNGKPVPVYGNGLNVREWLNVEDHCEAISLIVKRDTIDGKAIDGEIFNVGGNELCGNVSLIKKIIATLNASESLITFIDDRKGHDRKYALNCDKISKLLNWRPVTNFNAGLQETISWYKKVFNDK